MVARDGIAAAAQIYPSYLIRQVPVSLDADTPRRGHIMPPAVGGH